MRRSDCSVVQRTALLVPCTPLSRIKGASYRNKAKQGFLGTGAMNRSLSLPLLVCACVCVCIHGWLFCCDILTIWGSFIHSFIHSFNKYLLSSHVTWRSRVTLTSSFSRMERMKAWLENVKERKREEILGTMNMENSRCFALHKLEEWGWGNIPHSSSLCISLWRI